ncbi:MAG: RNP-1 like protein RNA-binding protein [candidate division WWE3 bacterium GW2011_GWA1_46_21]|uniref:RNP-1 like protein RNA-binding protein n=3 Tax=Katanobacteria TaxID=422282 RepID=A0A0G1RLN7_UNCKA|nr:MAG: RNP-1 like protein RNA-binding protein [candidate division WWE3 bacterium GW2011_GWA1_46_21]KKU48538.1 MAG: RNP-1 like protein RNA-binding protein [candidate division WWE3 bacterium GW2011_GWA2_46_9]KKU51068.1 MAG: RNP-1 like protein RNA-binding protein [candidate division WWE3 bacterium GW2011_GWC1_47_10]
MKLYVGNLPYSFDDAKLSDLFSQYGDVTSAAVIKDRDTGRSKGFGFVELGSDSAGQEAINGLNGKDYEGRALVVSVARPMEPREKRGGYSR